MEASSGWRSRRASPSATRGTPRPSGAPRAHRHGPVPRERAGGVAVRARCCAEGREATEARAYVAERGFTAEAIETFGIGYAPGYPDFLLRRLAGTRDLSPEILLEAGLATRGDDGVVRDRFRGRLTFPIHDLQGRAIGFGARILPGDRAPGSRRST